MLLFLYLTTSKNKVRTTISQPRINTGFSIQMFFSIKKVVSLFSRKNA